MHNAFRFARVPFLLALLASGCGTAPGSELGQRVRVAAYNVMELFDAKDDGPEFGEYSVAEGRWDRSRYEARLALVAEAVLSLAPGSPTPGPDVVCLEEVEGASVLEDLRSGPLARARYRYSASADAEGGPFACCLLSRLPIVSVSGHSATVGGVKAGRDVLEVELDAGGASLVVLACHWKSKVGGAEATEEARRLSAALVRGRVAARLAADPAAAVLVCGDFNESPDEIRRVGYAYPTALVEIEDADRFPDEARLLVASRAELARAGSDPALYSPWEDSGGYSYSYKGARERIDGFLVSPGLLESGTGREGLGFSAFSVGTAPFLVDEGGEPAKWNSSTRKGYSDHLPILLELAAR